MSQHICGGEGGATRTLIAGCEVRKNNDIDLISCNYAIRQVIILTYYINRSLDFQAGATLSHKV